MSDAHLAVRVREALAAAASEQPELQIRSVDVSRGWGAIVFVRIVARMHDGGGREAARRLQKIATAALEPERSSVSVTWGT